MKSSRVELDFFSVRQIFNFFFYYYFTLNDEIQCCPLRGNFKFRINQRLFFHVCYLPTSHEEWSFCIWTIFIFISIHTMLREFINRVKQQQQRAANSVHQQRDDDEPEVSTLIQSIEYVWLWCCWQCCRSMSLDESTTQLAHMSFAIEVQRLTWRWRNYLWKTHIQWAEPADHHRRRRPSYRTTVISLPKKYDDDDVFELFPSHYYEIPKNQ